MSQLHYVIIIPGLGNDTKKIKIATSFWHRYGFEIIVYLFDWYNNNKDILQSLLELGKFISNLSKNKNKVSLIGCSAGGSAALNAFYENNNVYKVVNVCGRLRKGTQKGFRSFATRTKSSKLFAQSVELCEERIDNLSKTDKKRIMTIKPLFGDELVPSNTTTLDGAKNITLPTGEHLVTIGTALTIFVKGIIDFLKE